MAEFEEGKKKWESDGAAVEDSNMANVGSQMDKDARKGAAEKEPAWEGCGAGPGLEIWRIEAFKVIAWPKEEYGAFYNGDSYIILSTTKDPEGDKLSWDIHFWLGKDTSQDEAGTAAYKTVELDDLMDGAPIQHRECMEHESTAFAELFPAGVRYLEGGVASGFKHVEPDAYIAKLLHVRKTKKHGMRTRQVPCTLSSLNEGDCFILDAGTTIYCWAGAGASAFEKREANSVAENMENERLGKATVTHDVDPKFWALLGGEPSDEQPIKTAAEVTDDSEEGGDVGEGVLYRLSDAHGDELIVSEVGRGEISPEMLDSNDVMLLDCSSGEVFVWVGAAASDREARNAMTTATSFLKAQGKPAWTAIHLFREGQKITNPLWHEIMGAPARRSSEARGSLSRRLSLSQTLEVAHDSTEWIDAESDVKLANLEDALTDADFEAAFGMGRAAFAALPKFKRDNLKSKCGLYH